MNECTQKNNENDQVMLESIVARQIVKEIIDFGVSQEQILKICKFLILELENVTVMKDINNIVDKHIGKIDLNNIDINSQNDNLITEI